MAQVVLDEGRNEVVAVVVTRLPPQRQRVAGILAGLLETIRHQLLLEELVGEPLVHEQWRPARHRGQRADQFAGVMGFPGLAVRAEVSRERLLAPGAMHWRRDRREGRNV